MISCSLPENCRVLASIVILSKACDLIDRVLLQKTEKGKLKHITVSLIKLAVISRVDCTFYTL